ncbi:hypothetical protein L5515_010299 [Caenorhabditis briggsae]|uniref:Uncharacterized protein n=1 Tax=Caenorhabditis briggsae TaxID=6238 RepID=A0AAE9EQT7_CAEBR|nr:hypothetical protein L5515_010299 [Caenorhabditis briggsae]
MGNGVSGEPVYLTRSTMLISHTPVTHHQPPAGASQCTFRRQSTIIATSGPSGATGSGISSQLTFPIQLYPNNVYHNHGYSAHVTGFEPHPSPTSTAHHHVNLNTATSSTSNHPSAPSEETPPSYSSIYPSLANRVN